MQSDTLVLQTVQRAIAAVGLDAIIIGNVAAALHGAPVTTLDIDYFIRDTRLNDEKLKRLADLLGVHISRPFEPASMVRRAVGLEVDLDFVVSLSAGMKFESVKSRASAIDVGGVVVIAASLEDVIASKRAAGRPKDLAVLPVLEATLEVRNKMFR
ncbi:MAG: nucleotidyltransferase [Myxococcales bacterium]|nr:nucleotidyltransferase [Myxococcales bacterium]